MKSILSMITVLLSVVTLSAGQVRNAVTETAKVYGNCADCKVAIEKAGSRKGLNQTVWDADSKMATIIYDNKKTTADAVLKQIALAGYDNTNYLAPDDVYATLQGCCKYQRENKGKAVSGPDKPAGNNGMGDHTGHDHENAASMLETPQLKAVFDNYFALKNALVASDGNTAALKAITLLAALEAVEIGKLAADEHVAWMKVEKQLKLDAQHIKENKDVEHQRGHFVTLSSGIYELVKAAKPSEAIYYQHCPMANDGKGANWLSKENIIKNPYYGNMMLSCGKTVEVIKQ